MSFGPWMMPVFRFLAKHKGLRGTAWDIFGYSAERKRERQMIKDYEALLDRIIPQLSSANHATVTQLAGLPMEIKGYGPVKQANALAVAKRREELLAAFRAGGTSAEAAE